jgi:HEAT repeat protein
LADRVVAAALDALGDDHGWARRRAASVLGRLSADVRHAHDVSASVAAAVGSGDRLRERGATLAVAELAVASGEYADALATLGEQLDSSDPWVRRNAVEGITKVATAVAEGSDLDATLSDVDVPIRERVRSVLSDSNPAVRAEACRCLGHAGTAADEDALCERTNDSLGRVRGEACDALARLRERTGGAGE